MSLYISRGCSIPSVFPKRSRSIPPSFPQYLRVIALFFPAVPLLRALVWGHPYHTVLILKRH